MQTTSALGLHRVITPHGALPQSAEVLDPSTAIREDETLIAVDTLNLDAASFFQLRSAHGDNADDIRAALVDIVHQRGKMHNPVTGSGGMLLGTVVAKGSQSTLDVSIGDRIASLVSLTATPLAVTDGAQRWDGRSEQVPVQGTAVLFGRTIATAMPGDLPEDLALAVLDVCGAPALTARHITERRAAGFAADRIIVIGGGKSGSLAAAAARDLGAHVRMAVPTEAEAEDLRARELCDEVIVADASSPVAMHEAALASGGLADITIVCVNRPGCEHGAILATNERGLVVYFSMSTQFSAAALGAEALAAA